MHSYFQYKENLFKVLVERIAERKIRMIFGEFLQFIRLLIGESGRFSELTKLFERFLHERAFGILNHYFSQQQDLSSKNIKALRYFFMGNLISYVLLQEIMCAKEINPLQEEFIEGLMEVMSAKKSV